MRPGQKTDASACWTAYKSQRSPEARDALILNYSPLVKYVAGRISSNLPRNVETADLISYGVFGLIDAIDRYDPERGIKFETYAIARIKGAILDELRSLDWVPRSVRARAREIEQAYVVLENRLRRPPTDAEVAAQIGVSERELQNIFTQLSYTSVVSFDELWTANGDADDRPHVYATLKDESADDPVTTFEAIELKEILAQAIEHLPEREKTVIALYYYEGLTLKEIGVVLGVTESRVSQLHTKAVLRLRARLRSTQGYIATR